MALLEDVFAWTTGSWVATLALGAGTILVAPIVLPVVGAGARLLAKGIIKPGMVVVTAGTAAVAEAGEQLRDLVAEVREELGEATTAATSTPTHTTHPPLVDEYGRTVETVGT